MVSRSTSMSQPDTITNKWRRSCVNSNHPQSSLRIIRLQAKCFINSYFLWMGKIQIGCIILPWQRVVVEQHAAKGKRWPKLAFRAIKISSHSPSLKMKPPQPKHSLSMKTIATSLMLIESSYTNKMTIFRSIKILEKLRQDRSLLISHFSLILKSKAILSANPFLFKIAKLGSLPLRV